jgi:hypothetical protein
MNVSEEEPGGLKDLSQTGSGVAEIANLVLASTASASPKNLDLDDVANFTCSDGSNTWKIARIQNGQAKNEYGVFHAAWVDNRTGVRQISTAAIRVESGSTNNWCPAKLTSG